MWVLSSWIQFLLLVATLAFLIYKYFTRNFNYWKNREIFNPPPVPFLGNLSEVVTFKTNMFGFSKKLYDSVDEPYFGIFLFDEPALFVKSPKMIKDILIKDFNTFCNRAIASPKHNKIVSNFLFCQRIPAWKQTRSMLTPLFSTGMMKIFFTVIKDSSEALTGYLEKHTVVDAKEISGHFSTEIIARCFFGVDPLCFENEISTFRKYVYRLLDLNWRNAIIQTLYFLKSTWVDLFQLDFVENDTVEYFQNVFKDAMTARSNYKGRVKNLIDIMNDIKESGEANSKTIDLEVVKANALFFMIAGQETTSTIVSFTLYELSLNQIVQDKLRKEIQVNVKKHGDLTFEGIQELKYLEKCINETMRKYTALPFLDRVAVSDYHFEGTDLTVQKGTKIIIPLFAMQRDEKFFIDPDKYDPDRFSQTHYNSNGLIYFPFGDGPRGCVGKRLAVISVALAVASVVLKFRLEKCDKTPEPLEFENKSLSLMSKTGLSLKFVKI